MNYDLEQKRELIRDILKILLDGEEIYYLQIEPGQRATFATAEQKALTTLYTRHELSWDNELNFRLTYYVRTWKDNPIGTAKWFKVGRLLSKRHLDTERLKNKQPQPF